MARFNTNSISNFIRFVRQLFKTEKVEEKGSRYKILWRKLRVWVMLAFGLSLFGILLSQISLKEFLNVFSSIDIRYFAAAFIAGISSTVFKSIRFGYFFPAPGRRVSLYGIFAFLRVLYYLLPFNTGELVYLSVLKKYRFSPTITETAPTWFFLRLTDIIALSIWIIVVLFLSPLTGSLYGKIYSVRWLIIGLAGGLIFFILSFPFWIPRIPLGKSEHWFFQRIKIFKSGFTRTFGINTLVKTLVISLLIWCLLILFDTFSLIAFNTPLTFAECFLASIALYCISLLPINAPMNIGTDEAIWTGILMLSGIASNQAISIALSIRVISLFVLLTEGLIGFSIIFIRQNTMESSISI